MPLKKKNTWNMDYIEIYNFCSPEDTIERIESQDIIKESVFRPASKVCCILSSCSRLLLHVLVLSFPPLTRGLQLCPVHLMKPLVMFVLGGPGAGKGTQCKRIVEKYGYTHLSAGEFLRDERKNPDSQYGELIEKYVKEGKIVPVEITISLLKREMDQTMAASAQKNKFLIDGFPRNQDNLQDWNKTMDGKADVSFVLFFDCNNEICIEQCLERGKSSGRGDDNRESLEKRIQIYLESTKPIIDLYEEMGKVKKIDASKSVDEVFGEVVKIFDKKGLISPEDIFEVMLEYCFDSCYHSPLLRQF